MLYYKYLKSDHANEMVRFGRIRIGSVYEFRHYEDSQRRDPSEGTKQSSDKFVERIIVAPKSTEDLPGLLGRIFKVPQGGSEDFYLFKNLEIISNDNFEDAFVYCVTDKPDRIIMKEFGCDTCVQIFDMEKFANSILLKLVNKKLAYPSLLFKPCKYEGKKSNYQNMDAYWLKDPLYIHQSEVRLIIPTLRENQVVVPQIIRVDTIPACCRIIKL